MFETVSFHVIKPCNMGCKFCYATYNTFNVKNQLSYIDACIIVAKLAEAGVQKITFAGGEPMLYKHLDAVIEFAKSIGVTTSIITNGSMITEEWLIKMQPYLDWIGVSIDSVDHDTNSKIGRVSRNSVIDYYSLVDLINKYDYKLKINTVVNIHNQGEYFAHFIKYSKTTRWKVFDTLRVEGQNDEQFDAIKSTDYIGYVQRNEIDVMVAENNELMTGSYLLIDPLGRFYENWGTETRKSDSLIDHDVEHCLNQISLNRAAFEERGGIYQW